MVEVHVHFRKLPVCCYATCTFAPQHRRYKLMLYPTVAMQLPLHAPHA
jgi:hypothetical protein